jgi:hypothetical protein
MPGDEHSLREGVPPDTRKMRESYAAGLLAKGVSPESITAPWLREEMLRQQRAQESGILSTFNEGQDVFSDEAVRPAAKASGDREAQRRRRARMRDLI